MEEYEVKVISWEFADANGKTSKCRLTQTIKRISCLRVGWSVLTVNDELVALWDAKSHVWVNSTFAVLPKTLEIIREADDRLKQ